MGRRRIDTRKDLTTVRMTIGHDRSIRLSVFGLIVACIPFHRFHRQNFC
jgi:hypothetical protein